MMKYTVAIVRTFLLELILILITVSITVFIMNSCKHKIKKTQMSMNNYLNYNSTHLNGGSTGYNDDFNPSDISYSEVQELNDMTTRVNEYVIKAFSSNNRIEGKQCMFNSGSTEGIVTAINWSKTCNKYGTVLGSRLDHPVIEYNCKNQSVPYKQLDLDSIQYDKYGNSNIKEVLDKTGVYNASMIFITQVSSTTGEEYPMDIVNDIREYYKTDSYEPLIIVDATQSIGKIPLEIDKYHVNGTIFTLHKLGGPFNSGIMIVNDTVTNPFKPLIAGTQQYGLRGGTYNAYSYLDIKKLLDEYEYDHDNCKRVWIRSMEYLRNLLKTSKHARVVEPTLTHTYNTILIKVDHCCLSAVNRLANEGIYVSTSTACSSSAKNNHSNSENDDNNNYIRISYLTGNEISNKVLERIVKEVQ